MEDDDISIRETFNTWETRANFGKEGVVMFLHNGEDVDDFMRLFRVGFGHSSLIQ